MNYTFNNKVYQESDKHAHDLPFQLTSTQLPCCSIHLYITKCLLQDSHHHLNAIHVETEECDINGFLVSQPVLYVLDCSVWPQIFKRIPSNAS